jgi:hypothetical protein
MSALGQKQTYAPQKAMSALAPIATAKADSSKGHVCFTFESGHVRCNYGCQLRARSGTHAAQQCKSWLPPKSKKPKDIASGANYSGDTFFF